MTDNYSIPVKNIPRIITSAELASMTIRYGNYERQLIECESWVSHKPYDPYKFFQAQILFLLAKEGFRTVDGFLNNDTVWKGYLVDIHSGAWDRMQKHSDDVCLLIEEILNKLLARNSAVYPNSGDRDQWLMASRPAEVMDKDGNLDEAIRIIRDDDPNKTP